MRALIVCITLLFAFLTCTMAQIPSVKVENTKGSQNTYDYFFLGNNL